VLTDFGGEEGQFPDRYGRGHDDLAAQCLKRYVGNRAI
jgi:hypothetical protein